LPSQDIGIFSSTSAAATDIPEDLAMDFDKESGPADTCVEKEKSNIKDVSMRQNSIPLTTPKQKPNIGSEDQGGENEKRKQGTYKKLQREPGLTKTGMEEVTREGGKRKAGVDLEGMKVDSFKKGRMETNYVGELQLSQMDAGPADRSCGNQ